MYKLNKNSNVIRLVDGALIPVDPDNNDYANYLLWVAQGGVTQAASLPLPPSKAIRISALVTAAGETRLTVQIMIEFCEDKAIAMGAKRGMTPEASIAFAYSRNKSYRTCKDLEATLLAIDAEI